MPDSSALGKEDRKLKRAAKREQQGQCNPGRARQMHVLRIEREKNKTLGPAPHNDPTPHRYIGCSGWFYWHWRAAFYPADLPTSRWFAHYAKRFKTVELNAPFYSWPTVGTV